MNASETIGPAAQPPGDHSMGSHGVATRWEAFRRWRHGRPFWAGAFTLLAALALISIPYATLRIGELTISLSTIGGASAVIIAALLLICAGSMWFRPQFRFAAGLMTILGSLVGLVTVNLGSFLISTTLGIIGGSLAVSWATPARRESASSSDDG